MDSIIDMNFDVRQVIPETMASAIEIAFKYNVSVYDAYFLALSQVENKPFLAADYKFAERVKRAKNIVRLREI